MDDDTRHFRFGSSNNVIDLYDSEEEDDSEMEFVCPFCVEDFDVVGFYCHFEDSHPIEAISGICLICKRRAGCSMASHIITQHRSLLTALHQKKQRLGYHSIVALTKKLSEDRHRDEEPLHVVSSSNMTADSQLSSFICNSPLVVEPEISRSSFTSEAKMEETRSDGTLLKSDPSPLPNKKWEEKARRYEFIQDLVCYTFLEDEQ